ncbi:hypothetical protein I41_15130 [Lacipirellula limnantheis]|uniref:Uncharacterized protein n=1 Tax=Lacipirellula limnantheis TaxID=2528024 RepID=A0A517TVD3_9BACT|nr:hypothetical protein I41_15130 [Lacipirellula limnantheis]
MLAAYQSDYFVARLRGQFAVSGQHTKAAFFGHQEHYHRGLAIFCAEIVEGEIVAQSGFLDAIPIFVQFS